MDTCRLSRLRTRDSISRQEKLSLLRAARQFQRLQRTDLRWPVVSQSAVSACGWSKQVRATASSIAGILLASRDCSRYSAIPLFNCLEWRVRSTSDAILAHHLLCNFLSLIFSSVLFFTYNSYYIGLFCKFVCHVLCLYICIIVLPFWRNKITIIMIIIDDMQNQHASVICCYSKDHNTVATL